MDECLDAPEAGTHIDKEVALFDELINLPKAARHRIVKAVEGYDLVEAALESEDLLP